jgi:hypothetical protein
LGLHENVYTGSECLYTEKIRFQREWVVSMGVKSHLVLIKLNQKKIARKKKTKTKGNKDMSYQ